MMAMGRKLGRSLADYLARPRGGRMLATSSPGHVLTTLRKGDVLLVEGTSRFATAIKYLTQSTWSHAALCVGRAIPPSGDAGSGMMLVEADVRDGVRAVPAELYMEQHTRICRPVGLSAAEIDSVVDYAVSRLGHAYDLRNIIDLARYLVPTPPVPRRWRRQMLALGSGDPTRAICSSLIAQAFQSVRYPILPYVDVHAAEDPDCRDCYREILHIRHHSLFAPRDFDVSPYFQVVKPALEHGFDPHALDWADHDARSDPASGRIPDAQRPEAGSAQAGSAAFSAAIRSASRCRSILKRRPAK